MINKTILLPFFTYLLYLFPLLGFGEVRFYTEVDKAMASTEEEITFRINLNKPAALDLTIPDFANRIEGFRIIDFGEDKPEIIQDHIRLSKWFKLKADISGTYVLPSITIDFVNQEGVSQTLKSSEIFIEIESPYAKKQNDNKSDSDSNSEIEDIRDIKDIARGSSQFIFILLLIMTITAIGIALWFLYRKIKKVKKEISILPHEKALLEIDRLKTINIQDKGNAKIFSFALSEIIRFYVEQHFGLPASDRTTDEIRREASPFIKNNDQEKTLINILEQTDFIKFTDGQLNPLTAENLINASVNFIRTTLPQNTNINHPQEDKGHEEDII